MNLWASFPASHPSWLSSKTEHFQRSEQLVAMQHGVNGCVSIVEVLEFLWSFSSLYIALLHPKGRADHGQKSKMATSDKEMYGPSGNQSPPAVAVKFLPWAGL